MFVLLLSSTSAFAAANYSESFTNVGSGTDAQGGPPVLVTRGWIFRNQSRPAGTGVSPYWTEFGSGWGQSGSCLGHGGFAVWQNSSSKISAWAILPAIPNQVAGDPLRIWTAAPTSAFGTNTATLEVRYSPTGATGTGSNENDVGSFAQILATISGTNGHPWTERLLTLPGSGRIAIRLVIGPGSSSDVFGGSFMIDSLQVGNPPPPPFPIPTVGQTVHWTMAHSPVVLSRSGSGLNPQIVSGATVIVDPGVEVRATSGTQLEIYGTLQLAGTSLSSVQLRGPGWFRAQKGGLIEGAFVDVQAFVDLIYGGKASFEDSTFTDPSNPTGFSYDSAGDLGHRFFDGNLDYARQIVSLTRCTFGVGCEVAVLRGWLAARECTFLGGGVVTNNPGPIGGEAMLVVGNSILDDVTVTDGFIDLMHMKHQHRYIGNVSVTGNPYGPGIRLEGGASYLIDPSVVLQGHKWPVNFGGLSAGILPGSQLPTTGNQFNEIPDTDDPSPSDEKTVWADAGIPYVVDTSDTAHGQVTILPGVTVKIHPNVMLGFDTDSHGVSLPVFLGEPGKPIRFIPYAPGSKWRGIGIGDTAWFGTRWDWCEFEDAELAVSSAELPLALDNCVFRRNIRGAGGTTLFSLRKCTFEDNVYSYSGEDFAPNHVVEGFLDANHPTNPNTFINNNGNPGPEFFGSFLPTGGLIARARHNSLENTDSDARNNWWGTPTGPHHPTLNPNGQGDDVLFGIDAGGFLLPFLTEAPTTNPPPVVRFLDRSLTLVPGEKVHFQWTARDDGSIATQRVYYSPDTNLDWQMQLLAEIPAGARSFEWTVPFIGTPANGADQYFRVVAVDNLGQEGIADLPFRITNPQPFTGNMVPQPITGELRPGDNPDICATVTPVVGSMYASLEFDNDDSGLSLGGLFASGNQACNILGAELPDISTDRARVRYDATSSLNMVKSFYGPYFSIRPDPLLGDEPPTILLTSSPAGQSVTGGSIATITWTASDDEAIRSFDIRASFDGGTRWFIVARDLSADTTSFNWQLPTSDGIADVRIRVVAKDKRFQNTSAESGAFEILPGQVGTDGDIDGDGLVGMQDVAAFCDVLLGLDTDAAHFSASDLTGDGMADGRDVRMMVSAVTGG